MVKSGKDIKNMNDVQNLVIGIINRQAGSYTQERICELVEYYLHGASVNLNQKEIAKLVDENLSVLYLKGFVSCKGGIYKNL